MKTTKAEKEIESVLKKYNASALIFIEEEGGSSFIKNHMHILALLDFAKSEIEFSKRMNEGMIEGWVEAINQHSTKKEKKPDYMG